MADRPGEADADVAEILHTLDAFHCVPDHGTRAALDRLTARLSEAEAAIDRVDGWLFDEIDVDRSMDELLARIMELRKAEARLSEAERDLAQECEWHHRAELGWADERMRADAAEARLSDYEQALRGLWEDLGAKGQRETTVEVERLVRAALSRGAEIPPEDLDWNNAEVHGHPLETEDPSNEE